MTHFPDAWAAARGRPGRFLTSSWPWRSLAYVATTVPVGLVALVALFIVLGIGLLTLVVVVGVLVLAAVPRMATVVADVERRRLGLVLPGAIQPRAGSLREQLRARRNLPIVWAEVGYAVILATLLWVLDAVLVTLLVITPVVFLMAPVLVRTDQLGMFGWQIDSTREAWIAVGIGLPALVFSAYAVTVLAVAQGALTRLLLDPEPAGLAAAVTELRQSRVGLVDAFETERRRIERDLHDGVQQRLVALTMTLGRAELDVPDGPARTWSARHTVRRRRRSRSSGTCAASTRRCWPTMASPRRCTRSRTARRCPSTPRSGWPAGCRRRSRRRRTSWSVRH